MAFYGFIKGPAGHNLTTSWFMFSNGFLGIDQLMAYANLENDRCIVDKIEYDAKDNTLFNVHIKDIKREYISQNFTFQFHLIYTTKGGKIYKQTVEYGKETFVWPAQELNIDKFEVRLT